MSDRETRERSLPSLRQRRAKPWGASATSAGGRIGLANPDLLGKVGLLG